MSIIGVVFPESGWAWRQCLYGSWLKSVILNFVVLYGITLVMKGNMVCDFLCVFFYEIAKHKIF